MPPSQRLYVVGMHGLGDCIHQRAVFRKWLDKYDIWLETSWPTVYHDMPIHFIARGTKLRTQLKNVDRQNDKFAKRIPFISHKVKITYKPQEVRQHGSVLAGMMRHVGLSPEGADFSFSVPDEWVSNLDAFLSKWVITKPILFYRPLVKRVEWKGCDSRNPDKKAYAELARYIREKFFVISVADTIPDTEWIVSDPIGADLEFHKGELSFEMLAALMKRSTLAYASPGFTLPLARAVGTPVICVFGGFENSKSFALGHGPYLGIDTICPCECFSHDHACDKTIDIDDAKNKIRGFLDAFVT